MGPERKEFERPAKAPEAKSWVYERAGEELRRALLASN